MEILKFEEAGVDNRETERNHNDESPAFDEEREDREIRENMRIMSISSRHILSSIFSCANLLSCVSFPFPMFDSAGRYLATFLSKDNSFFLT